MNCKDRRKKACGLDTVSSRPWAYRRGWCVSNTPRRAPGSGKVGGPARQSILAEQTHGPPSTLSPLCTEGVRPSSTELHFMVTKITMPLSRNCQQHCHAQVFGPIFAEPGEPRLLRDIDLDSSLTRKSRMPRSSRSSTVALGMCDIRQMCGVLENQLAWLSSLFFPYTWESGWGEESGISRLLMKMPKIPCKCHLQDLQRGELGRRSTQFTSLSLFSGSGDCKGFLHDKVFFFMTRLNPTNAKHVPLQIRVLLLPGLSKTLLQFLI